MKLLSRYILALIFNCMVKRYYIKNIFLTQIIFTFKTLIFYNSDIITFNIKKHLIIKNMT